MVVLDGFTLNPGDLDWSQLEAIGPLQVYDRTLPAQVMERAQGASILLTNKTPISAEIIQAIPSLELICVLATGYNVVDTAAARERNIPVVNVPGYSTASVVQLVWALILEHTNHVAAHSDVVRTGGWANCVDFSFTVSPLLELAGKTLGIVGYGAIGQAVAAVGRAMGMKVLVSTRTPREGIDPVSLDRLFAESDIISLHCPLTDATKGLVSAARLATMKRSALLINTGRGPLVVEADLADALNHGIIAGAGLDVLSVEPPTASNPLLTAKNCIITPHIAWATKEARERLLRATVENVTAFLSGSPKNVVN
jgi:glycerate dehydrogenase